MDDALQARFDEGRDEYINEGIEKVALNISAGCIKELKKCAIMTLPTLRLSDFKLNKFGFERHRDLSPDGNVLLEKCKNIIEGFLCVASSAK